MFLFFCTYANANAKAQQFKSMVVIHSSSLLGRKVHCILFTEESRSSEQPERFSRDTKQQWHRSYLQVTEC